MDRQSWPRSRFPPPPPPHPPPSSFFFHLQYGFVIGVVYLSFMMAGPAFAEWGRLLGPRNLYACGMAAMVLAGGLGFALLDYVRRKAAFLILGITFR